MNRGVDQAGGHVVPMSLAIVERIDLSENCCALIFGRYVGPNVIHQYAMIPRDNWVGSVDWLSDLEFACVGLPEPNAPIYLHVDHSVSKSLMSGLYGRDEPKKGIHGTCITYLASCCEVADWRAERLGWQAMECLVAGGLRRIADIHDEVLAVLGQLGSDSSAEGRR